MAYQPRHANGRFRSLTDDERYVQDYVRQNIGVARPTRSRSSLTAVAVIVLCGVILILAVIVSAEAINAHWAWIDAYL